MSKNFPHMGQTPWPDVSTYDTTAAERGFDYSRWRGGTKLKLMNVPWDSQYRNVVKFDDNETRDKWFDAQESQTIELESDCQIQPNNTVRLPVPEGTLQNFNYMVVDFPPPTSAGDPLHYSDPDNHIEKWHYFIIDTQYIAPNCVEATIQHDYWTTFINDIKCDYMMLTRGHAPLAKSDVDKYLSDPINNNEYLLAEDWNAGTADVISSNKYYPIGNGTKWACFAVKAAASQIRDLNLCSPMAANPKSGSYYARAGRFPHEEYQEGIMPDEFYNWDNRGLYNTWPQDLETYLEIHDDDWEIGPYDPEDMIPEVTTVRTDGNVVAPTVIAVPAENMVSALAHVHAWCPAFFDLIEACFILSQEHITLGDSFTFCTEEWREVKPANQAVASVKLAREDFNFDEKYENLAKLYTSPYSVLEITDNENNVVEIQIERTTSDMSLESKVNLAYPYLSVEVFLAGVGGGSTTKYTWKNVVGTEYEKYLPKGDLYTFWKSYDIPTFAIYQTGYEKSAPREFHQRDAQHWVAKMAEYVPATQQVNNTWANTVHNAINEYYNQTGRHPNIAQDDYSYWWSKGGEPNLPTLLDLTNDPNDFKYHWDGSWQNIDDYKGNIEANYDRTVGLAEENKDAGNRNADQTANDRIASGEASKEDRIGMAKVNDEDRRTSSTATRNASDRTALANKNARNTTTAAAKTTADATITTAHDNNIRRIAANDSNAREAANVSRYQSENVYNNEKWTADSFAQLQYLQAANKMSFEELNRFRTLYYDANKLQRDNIYNQENVVEDRNLIRDNYAHEAANDTITTQTAGATNLLSGAFGGGREGYYMTAADQALQLGGATIAGGSLILAGAGIGAAIGAANWLAEGVKTAIGTNKNLMNAATQARYNQRKANMSYEKNFQDFREVQYFAMQNSNSILQHSGSSFYEAKRMEEQSAEQSRSMAQNNTNMEYNRAMNAATRSRNADTTNADNLERTDHQNEVTTKNADDSAAQTIYDGNVEAAKINDDQTQDMSPKILAETTKQATNIENVNETQATNAKNVAHTNNDSIYNETVDRAKEVGNAQARAVQQSYSNTIENADRTKWVGEFATQRRYEAAFKNTMARVKDMRLDPPITYGTYTGSQLNAAMQMQGISMRVKTQSKDAIAQVGDRFLRYGYALNRAWHLNNMNELKCMNKFSYWECAEVWLQGGNGTIERAQEAIRNIFTNGTTVWNKPEEVGSVSIYENEVSE